MTWLVNRQAKRKMVILNIVRLSYNINTNEISNVYGMFS